MARLHSSRAIKAEAVTILCLFYDFGTQSHPWISLFSHVLQSTLQLFLSTFRAREVLAITGFLVLLRGHLNFFASDEQLWSLDQLEK